MCHCRRRRGVGRSKYHSAAVARPARRFAIQFVKLPLAAWQRSLFLLKQLLYPSRVGVAERWRWRRFQTITNAAGSNGQVIGGSESGGEVEREIGPTWSYRQSNHRQRVL